MLRTDTGDRSSIDPDDVRDLVRGLAFLALLGLGLYVNVLIG